MKKKKKRAIKRMGGVREMKIRISVVSNLLHRMEVLERDVMELRRAVGLDVVLNDVEAVGNVNRWLLGGKCDGNGLKGEKVKPGTILGTTLNYNNRIKRK